MPNTDTTFTTYQALINRLETHKVEMEKMKNAERKLEDAFINGYNCGLQDGIESAINLIKQIGGSAK